MASNINVFFYFPQRTHPLESLTSLLRAISSSPLQKTLWQRTTLQSQAPTGPYHVLGESKSASELIQLAYPLYTDHCRIAFEDSMELSEYQPAGGLLRIVPIELKLMGPLSGFPGRRTLFDASISLSIDGTELFQLPDCEVESPEWQASLSNTATQNNRVLLDLVEHTITSTTVEAVAIYDDSGLNLPINAHYYYFRQIDVALNHLQSLAAIWREGHPGYPNDPPLKNLDLGAHDYYLHTNRNDQEKIDLWSRINPPISSGSNLSLTQLHSTINSLINRGSLYALAGGFAIQSAPIFMNSFIDSFLLDTFATGEES